MSTSFLVHNARIVTPDGVVDDRALAAGQLVDRVRTLVEVGDQGLVHRAEPVHSAAEVGQLVGRLLALARAQGLRDLS